MLADNAATDGAGVEPTQAITLGYRVLPVIGAPSLPNATPVVDLFSGSEGKSSARGYDGLFELFRL